MELEQPTADNSGVSVEARMAASSRKLTLEPLHADITPTAPIADPVGTAAVATTIPTIQSDMETTLPPHVASTIAAAATSPSITLKHSGISKKHHRIALASSIVVVTALTSLVGYLMFFK